MEESANAGEELKVPKWLLSVVVLVLIGIFGTGITTWAQSNDNSQVLTQHGARLDGHDGRIGALEAHVSAIDQNLKDVRDTQMADSAKLDRILQIEAEREAMRGQPAFPK